MRRLVRPLSEVEQITVRKALLIARQVAWGHKPTCSLEPPEVAAVERVLRAVREGQEVR